MRSRQIKRQEAADKETYDDDGFDRSNAMAEPKEREYSANRTRPRDLRTDGVSLCNRFCGFSDCVEGSVTARTSFGSSAISVGRRHCP